MFFERLRTKRQNRAVIERVYESVVERARRPALFQEGGLPDTVMGRYEALGIEVLLLLQRCKDDESLRAFAQDLVDRFMLDMDHSLREIGIGYQGVPRRMRKLANRFYTRVADYRGPLEAGDEQGLAVALRNRAYGDVIPGPDAPHFLARDMLASARTYAAISNEALLSGRIEIEVERSGRERS